MLPMPPPLTTPTTIPTNITTTNYNYNTNNINNNNNNFAPVASDAVDSLPEEDTYYNNNDNDDDTWRELPPLPPTGPPPAESPKRPSSVNTYHIGQLEAMISGPKQSSLNSPTGTGYDYPHHKSLPSVLLPTTTTEGGFPLQRQSSGDLKSSGWFPILFPQHHTTQHNAT